MEKSPDAFRTISEVAEDLDVPQHVLRFWETRFRDIKPMKRGGGRRYYRPDDVDLLRGIRHLLYGEGYTIRGVQRILREQGVRFVQNVWQPGAPQPSHRPAEDVEGDEEAAPAPETGKARGLLSFLPSRGAPAGPAGESEARIEPSMRRPERPAAVGGEGLSDDDAERLRHALQQLLECRRLLDAAVR